MLSWSDLSNLLGNFACVKLQIDISKEFVYIQTDLAKSIKLITLITYIYIQYIYFIGGSTFTSGYYKFLVKKFSNRRMFKVSLNGHKKIFAT